MNDAIRYTITVTAIIERTQMVGKDWAIVGQKYEDGITDKPVDVRGYTPEIEKVVQKEIKVYEQAVDSLDMAALIKAVNGITP